MRGAPSAYATFATMQLKTLAALGSVTDHPGTPARKHSAAVGGGGTYGPACPMSSRSPARAGAALMTLARALRARWWSARHAGPATSQTCVAAVRIARGAAAPHVGHFCFALDSASGRISSNAPCRRALVFIDRHSSYSCSFIEASCRAAGETLAGRLGKAHARQAAERHRPHIRSLVRRQRQVDAALDVFHRPRRDRHDVEVEDLRSATTASRRHSERRRRR